MGIFFHDVSAPRRRLRKKRPTKQVAAENKNVHRGFSRLNVGQLLAESLPEPPNLSQISTANVQQQIRGYA